MEIKNYISRPTEIKAFQFDRESAIKLAKLKLDDIDGHIFISGFRINWFFDRDDLNRYSYMDENIWFSVKTSRNRHTIINDKDFLMLDDNNPNLICSVISDMDFKAKFKPMP